MRARRRSVVWIAAALSLLSSASLRGQSTEKGIVFVVRHAEPAMGDDVDPGLNGAGRIRALSLAATLADAGVAEIFSTRFVRAQETAAPLASTLLLGVTTYPERDVLGLARTLRSVPGRAVLVVAHSNTAHALISALGGEAGPPIDPAYEFDRLYAVVLRPDAPPVTLRLRYGPVSGR